MKLSLHSVAYGGYFYDGAALTLEDIVRRAAEFGYDAVEIFAHRPVGFPMDLSSDRRKALVDLAGSLGVKFSALEAGTNFLEADHILAQRKEKELLFLRECCELARDLDCPNVLIFAAWLGYFMPEHWQQGYSNTAMHSRSMEVSTEDDYLRNWDHARDAIREGGRIAADYGVTLGLQNHPPLTNTLQDCIDMVEEVDHPNVKIAADVCLLEQQDEQYVKGAFRQIGDRLIHSHALGIKFKVSLAGGYGFEEVVPGEGRENWPAFFEVCAETGYKGHLSYEQCSPIILRGHKRAGIDEIDRRFRAGREYLAAAMSKAGVLEGRAAAAGR